MLVDPPYREPEEVPVAMAKAAVVLRRDGHDVTCVDANQALWAEWLAPGFLAGKLQRMAGERRRREAAGALCDGDEAYRHYRALRATVGVPRLLAQLPAARAALAARTSPAPERAWAKRIIGNFPDVALWPIPGEARLNDLTLTASTECSADVSRMARGGDDANPFFGFWSDWIGRMGSSPTETLVIWLEADQQLIPGATLAARLKAGGRAPRIVVSGPFVGFLSDLATAAAGPPWWSGLFDALKPNGPEGEPDSDGLAAELRSLVARRHGASGASDAAPRVVAPSPRTVDPDHLASEMAAIAAAFEETIVHLPTPRSVADLLAIAARLRAGPWAFCAGAPR